MLTICKGEVSSALFDIVELEVFTEDKVELVASETVGETNTFEHPVGHEATSVMFDFHLHQVVEVYFFA